MRSRRLFFGLLLPSGDGEELINATKQALGGDDDSDEDYRFPRSNGLHLTLYFLGDTQESRIETIWSAVIKHTAEVPAPRMILQGAGGFPSLEDPRVLWMGLREEEGAEGRLLLLRERLLEALEEAGDGLAWDRAQSFVPHVTVARPKKKAQGIGDFGTLDFTCSWTPQSLYLVESRKIHGVPPRYVPLQGAALAP